MCKELFGDSQSRALGYLYAAGGVVQLVAPSLSGLTYATSARFPALVPSLVGATLALAALVSVAVYLPETLEAPQSLGLCHRGRSRKTNTRRAGKHSRLQETAEAAEVAEPAAADAMVVGPSTKLPAATPDAPPSAPLPPSAPPSPSVSPPPTPLATRGTQTNAVLTRKALCGTQLGLLCLARALQGSVLFAAFDLLPLWAIAATSVGGLGLSEAAVGVMLAVAAGGTLFFSAFCLSRVLEAFGSRAAMRTSAALAAASLVCLPLSQRAFVDPASTVAAPLSVILGCALMSSIFSSALNLFGAALVIAMNDEIAKDHAARAGQLNGIIVTVETLGKALGPATCGPLFAWAVGTGGVDVGEGSRGWRDGDIHSDAAAMAGHDAAASATSEHGAIGNSRVGPLMVFALVAALVIATGELGVNAMDRNAVRRVR